MNTIINALEAFRKEYDFSINTNYDDKVITCHIDSKDRLVIDVLEQFAAASKEQFTDFDNFKCDYIQWFKGCTVCWYIDK